MSEHRERYDSKTGTWVDETLDVRTGVWRRDDAMPHLQSKEDYRACLSGLPDCVMRELRLIQEEHSDDEDIREALVRLQLDPCSRQRRHDKMARSKLVEAVQLRMLHRQALQAGLVWDGSRWIELEAATGGLPQGVPNRCR